MALGPIRESPLPRPLGNLESSAEDCFGDCLTDNSAGNPENGLDCNPFSYPERNPAICLASCREGCPTGRSSGCSENRFGGNRESNLPSSGASSLLSHSESYQTDYVDGYPENRSGSADLLER